MPVLPEVGSIRTWSGLPGTSTPARSASSMSESATRSFTEPPGFCPSSLMKMLAAGLGLSALMSIIGVLPMRSSTVGYKVMPASSRTPQPPATAGRMDTSAPSATGVSRPCRYRTSSSST